MLSVFVLALCFSSTLAAPVRSEAFFTTSTFFTQPISVKPAGIAFMEIPVEVPVGPIALNSLRADLIDADNNSVPLSEAYFHHWFISVLRPPANASAGPAQEVAHFGAGSEIRHAPETLPPNTACYFDGTETWRAQVHLIDLRLSDPAERLPCIECRRRISCEDGSCLSPWLRASNWTQEMYEEYDGG